MTKLATEVRTFNDHAITFQTDGWFNATEAAEMIGRGIGYDERKPMIKQYALDWRLEHSMGLLK